MSARRSLTRGIGEQLRLLDPGLSDLVRTPHHLVDGAALHDGLREQMAGELHLTEHAHLRIGGLAMLGAGLGKGSCVVRGIGGSPHHAIDGEQLQPGPAWVIGLLVPARGGLVKQPLDALVPELLAGLQEGAGGNKVSRKPGAIQRLWKHWVTRLNSCSE